MSMTTQEAIKFLSQYVDNECYTPKCQEANRMAIAALLEKAEREDPRPLTIKELAQMHGQPVWMEDEKVWGIINVDEHGQFAGKPFIEFYWRRVNCNWDIERRGLKCYRHKPPEATP